MNYSNKHFQLCRVFVDETDLTHNDTKNFMWGALLMPIDCDLGVRLGQLRKRLGFTHTIHFSEGQRFSSNEKEFIAGALKEFHNSSAVFRGIVASKHTWTDINSHVGKAKLAGQLLSYSWMPYEDNVYKILSGSRIIFDRVSLNSVQEKTFVEAVNKMITRPNKLPEEARYPIRDASVTFSDTRTFDELQLVDVLNGVVRTSYIISRGEDVAADKKKLHDTLIAQHPNIKSLVEVNRTTTKQKLNVWHFRP